MGALKNSSGSLGTNSAHIALASTATAEITVSGLPASVLEACSPQEIVARVLDKLQLPNLKQDVLVVREMKRKNVTHQPTSPSGSKRPLVSLAVAFKSVTIRDHVINTKRRYRDLHLRDLFNDVDCTASKTGTVYVNELLPAAVHRLFKQTKMRARQLKLRFVWHRDGVIMVKCDETSPVVVISCEDDLNKLCDKN